MPVKMDAEHPRSRLTKIWLVCGGVSINGGFISGIRRIIMRGRNLKTPEVGSIRAGPARAEAPGDANINARGNWIEQCLVQVWVSLWVL